MVHNGFEMKVEVLDIKGKLKIIQATKLFKSTRILRRVLEALRYLLSHILL